MDHELAGTKVNLYDNPPEVGTQLWFHNISHPDSEYHVWTLGYYIGLKSRRQMPTVSAAKVNRQTRKMEASDNPHDWYNVLEVVIPKEPIA